MNVMQVTYPNNSNKPWSSEDRAPENGNNSLVNEFVAFRRHLGERVLYVPSQIVFVDADCIWMNLLNSLNLLHHQLEPPTAVNLMNVLNLHVDL